MANQYTWNILQLDAYPKKEGLENVVFTVHWTLTGEDEDGNTGSTFGAAPIALASDTNFTPISELQKEQVVQWVVDYLGEETVAQYHQSIDKQIEDKVNPPVISYPGSSIWGS